MTEPVYILSASAISPQFSFEPSEFLDEPVSSSDGRLYVADADYREFINPVAIRRMSRQMKMGISAGMKALKLAGIDQPDAIITGTGLGSMTDMEHFLKDMIRFEEEALNPSFFIQSTYNSVNGWIALQSKTVGYNQTFVNRGFSLELSMLDAQLLLGESAESRYALVGCFDELTPDYFTVKSKIHYWKKDIPESLSLLEHSNTPGTIAGEGTAFFVLSNNSEHAICSLRGIKMLQNPIPNSISSEIAGFLESHGLTRDDIDVMICGMNGDADFQSVYNNAFGELSENTSVAVFKHLTGEYPTSSGFAVWLATQFFSNQEIPALTLHKKGNHKEIRHILILNHYILDSVSLILLSA